MASFVANLRTLGVKHPNGLSKTVGKKGKKFKKPICAGCNGSRDEEFIECDVCNDPFHILCAGQKPGDVDFVCENCTELLNGV